MSAPDTADFILESSVRAIADASPAAALSFLTPTRIAEASHQLIAEGRTGVRPLTPPNIAFHYAREDTARQFDRERLVDELIARICHELAELQLASAERYVAATKSLRDTGSTDALREAISADLENHRPGVKGISDDGRKRLYFVAIALCEIESTIATSLRTTDAATNGTFENFYRSLLETTRRHMIDGYDIRDLSILMSMLLQGHDMRYRYASTRCSSALGDDKLHDALMRVFWAFTVSEDDSTDNVNDMFIASIRDR